MNFKITVILILCLCFIELSVQQSHYGQNNKHSRGKTYKNEPTNWKTILVIVLSVLFFGAIIYGTSCYYICKMHFFERTEKKYTKMDSVTHV